jgi:hypothetical protein
MDTPSDIETGKVLGLVLAFDYLMKNKYIEAAEDLALRIEMSNQILVRWSEDEGLTLIEDPFTRDVFKMTDKAFT